MRGYTVINYNMVWGKYSLQGGVLMPAEPGLGSFLTEARWRQRSLKGLRRRLRKILWSVEWAAQSWTCPKSRSFSRACIGKWWKILHGGFHGIPRGLHDAAPVLQGPHHVEHVRGFWLEKHPDFCKLSYTWKFKPWTLKWGVLNVERQTLYSPAKAHTKRTGRTGRWGLSLTCLTCASSVLDLGQAVPSTPFSLRGPLGTARAWAWGSLWWPGVSWRCKWRKMGWQATSKEEGLHGCEVWEQRLKIAAAEDSQRRRTSPVSRRRGDNCKVWGGGVQRQLLVEAARSQSKANTRVFAFSAIPPTVDEPVKEEPRKDDAAESNRDSRVPPGKGWREEWREGRKITKTKRSRKSTRVSLVTGRCSQDRSIGHETDGKS